MDLKSLPSCVSFCCCLVQSLVFTIAKVTKQSLGESSQDPNTAPPVPPHSPGEKTQTFGEKSWLKTHPVQLAWECPAH